MSQSQLQSSRLEDEFQTKFTQLTNKVTSGMGKIEEEAHRQQVIDFIIIDFVWLCD